MKKYKRAITYGTFDLFHFGHYELIKRISDISEIVYVGLSTDKFNHLKNKKSHQSYEKRLEVLAAFKLVHKIIPESSWDQKINDVRRMDIDLFVMGDDWKGKFDYLGEYCDVIYLSRTEGISSTNLRDNLVLQDV